MYIMCIVCLGYLSFLPTSAIASVLCTCISMYMFNLFSSTSAAQIRSQVSAAFSSDFTDTIGIKTEPQKLEGSFFMSAIASGLQGAILVGICVVTL